MRNLKILFTQASFISFGIFIICGIVQLIHHYSGDPYIFDWYFIPSVILTSLICSLPSMLFAGENIRFFKLKLILHFVILFGAVSFLGFVFRWYSNIIGYLIVMSMFIFVYVFVWCAMLWIYKKDDKAINSALDSIRDKE